MTVFEEGSQENDEAQGSRKLSGRGKRLLSAAGIIAALPLLWFLLDIGLVGDFADLARNPAMTVDVNTVLNIFTLAVIVVALAALLLDLFDRFTKWEFRSSQWVFSVVALLIFSRLLIWVLSTEVITDYSAVRDGLWRSASNNSWLILSVVGIGGSGILWILIRAKFMAHEWSASDIRGIVAYSVLFGALAIWLLKDGQYTFLMEEGGKDALAKTFKVAALPIILVIAALFANYRPDE